VTYFDAQLRSLSLREMVIMFYVSQGFDTAQIASEMGITYQTVKGELYRVRNKLGHDGAYIQLMLRIRQAIA